MLMVRVLRFVAHRRRSVNSLAPRLGALSVVVTVWVGGGEWEWEVGGGRWALGAAFLGARGSQE